MLGIEQFKKIQEYKNLKISKLKVSEILNISYSTVDRWWDKDEEFFYSFEKSHEFILDNYREYIINLIKVYPEINNNVVLSRLKEEFGDFDIPKSTFYRYIKSLRLQVGLEKPKRNYKMQEVIEPGYQAQVDFGQYAMKSMYGSNMRVYFFVMTLSYSRMKFAYFSIEPFDAKKVVEAHEFAFRYFGGRPEIIVYDQDRTMVVSKNLGDIIFVKEFEDYVKEVGYSIYLCKGYDPETKGKVEKAVDYVKRNFLDGRTYYGIDRLNVDCINWLDRDGNGQVHTFTKKAPRELFRKGANLLVRVYEKKEDDIRVLTLFHDALEYNDNFYKVPTTITKDGDRVRVEKNDDYILIYQALTNDLICKHKLVDGVGKVIKVPVEEIKELLVEEELLALYKDKKEVTDFIVGMRKQKPRYIYPQCRRFIKLRKIYNEDQLLEGIKFCNKKEIYTIMELSSFLLYKYGEDLAKKHIQIHVFKHYKQEADKIREKENGRYI